MPRLLLLALVAIALLAPDTGLACSVGDDYRVPTNLELTAEADVILLGRIGAGSQGESPEDWSIVVEPIAALKGALPAEPIVLEGMMVSDTDFAVPSNPYELQHAHPVAYIGGCIRYIFQEGRTALFFLAWHEGELVSLGPPFSRWAEDVPSEDAPWPRAVRIYVETAAQSTSRQEAVLIAARDRLLATEGDPDAILIARDIDRQLEGPNRHWNAIMQEQIYSISATEEVERDIEAAIDELNEASEGSPAEDRPGAGLSAEEEAAIDAMGAEMDKAVDEMLREMESAPPPPEE